MEKQKPNSRCAAKGEANKNKHRATELRSMDMGAEAARWRSIDRSAQASAERKSGRRNAKPAAQIETLRRASFRFPAKKTETQTKKQEPKEKAGV
jgi:hypothetical protein